MAILGFLCLEELQFGKEFWNSICYNTITMKKLKKFALLILSLLIISLIVDIFIFRGYFLADYTGSKKTYGDYSNKVSKISYSVKKLGNSNYYLTLDNNSFSPIYIWSYRNEELIQKFNDSILFQYASRYKIKFPLKETEYHYGFDCGTGVGMTAIRPFESFSLEVNYNYLLDFFDIRYDHYNEINLKDSVINDLFYNKPLFLEDNGKFLFVKNIAIGKKDSVKVNFYLPTFTFFRGEIIYAKSNEVKFSYLDLLNKIKERDSLYSY